MAKTEIIEKWVTALESGEYKQAKGTLQRVISRYPDDSPGFCCLGVLCDLAVKEGIISEPDTSDVTRATYVTYDEYGYPCYDDSSLPRVVQEWAGLDDSNPTVDISMLGLMEERYNGEDDLFEDVIVTEDTLAELNDDRGATFEDIAKVIRTNFLEVKNG